MCVQVHRIIDLMNEEKRNIYREYKKENNELVLFFRVSGKSYEAYFDDADIVSELTMVEAADNIASVPAGQIYEYIGILGQNGVGSKTIQCIDKIENTVHFSLPDVNSGYIIDEY